MTGWNKSETYKKIKTWIFLLLVFYEFTVVIRYIFTLYHTRFYYTVLIFAQILQSVVEYLVCYFYAVKTSKRLTNAEMISKILKIGLFILVVTLTFSLVYWYVDLANSG